MSEESGLPGRQMTFLMLPNDLIFSCLGRVSRLYYPILALVSKSLRSLLASPGLYETRSLLGHTESCLYVSLGIHCTLNGQRWFTLCQRPKSSTKILVPVSSHNTPYSCMSGAAMVGSSIYTIGGLLSYDAFNDNTLSSVTIMDCREGPSMRVARLSPSVCVLDGKIYVMGGCKNADSTNLIEVFDTKTQTWEFLHIPSEEICLDSKYNTVGYEGTIYVNSTKKNATFKLHKGKWRAADLAMKSGWTNSYCVIDNVLYQYSDLDIRWYDSFNKVWRALKGLPRACMPFFSLRHRDRLVVKLAEWGGNMVILWQKCMIPTQSYRNIIWCGEIGLKRDQQGDIWGTLKWSDVVCTTNEPNGLGHAFSTTL